MTSESGHGAGGLGRSTCPGTARDLAMDDIVKDFLIESRENLDRLDQELVSLESDPGAKNLLASIFRTIHTIKGSCGFLGFAQLEKVAHAVSGGFSFELVQLLRNLVELLKHGADLGICHEVFPDQSSAIVLGHYNDRRLVQAHIDH